MSDDGGTLIGGSLDAQVHRGHRGAAIFDASNATFVLTTFSASCISPRVQR
jgi:hypothetical protein